MLDDETLGKLVPEIFSRLNMIDEVFEYEIKVPNREAILGVIGSGQGYEFKLIPIVTTMGSRKELPARTFTLRVEGTMEIAGQIDPNIKVISTDQSEIELWAWLRSDPWSAA